MSTLEAITAPVYLSSADLARRDSDAESYRKAVEVGALKKQVVSLGDVDIRVAPSLHPGTVEALDGYNQATAPYIASTMDLFADTYKTLQKLHDARELAEKNKAWTPEQTVMRVGDKVFYQQQRIAKKFDSIAATLDKQIKGYATSLTEPMESKAARDPMFVEIRTFAREMSSGDRMKLLDRMIENKDEKTATAILAAPAYLSGLTDDMQRVYLQRFRERITPEIADRLKVLRGAKDLVDRCGPLMLTQFEKSTGSTWQKITAIKAGNSSAMAALELSS